LVKDLSKTRWSDRYEAIRAVFVSYKEIINTLEKLSGDDIETNTQQTAKNLRNKLCSFTFYSILLFLKNLLASINALIVHLQKVEIDILATIDITENTIHLLHQMHDDNTTLDALIEVCRFTFFSLQTSNNFILPGIEKRS
jgi:DNA-binding Xre family transcriptional regulator